MHIKIFLIFIFSVSLCAVENQATRFRGPNGQGIYANETAPVSWSNEDIVWSLDLPGNGHASPVAWGNTVFAVSADADKYMYHVLAVDATNGALIWQKEFPFAKYKVRKESSFATSSPTVDEMFLYVLFASQEKTTMVAMRHNGSIAWKKEFDGVVSRHGFGTSPICVDDKVVFTREQESVKNSPFKSTWFALNKRTGEKVWEVERQTGERNAFSTPCLVTMDKKEYLVFTSEGGFTAVDPSDGKIVWEIDPFTMRTISSPILANGLIIGTCKGKLYTIKLNDLNKPDLAYELVSKYSPYCPSPLYMDGLLYNFMDNGYISCHKSTTGDLIWREKPAGKFMGSPIAVDGRLYAMTTNGEMVVLNKGDRYELLAINELPEGTQSTPIVVHGFLYVQTLTKLMRIGK